MMQTRYPLRFTICAKVLSRDIIIGSNTSTR